MANPTATLETSLGTFTVELFTDRMGVDLILSTA